MRRVVAALSVGFLVVGFACTSLSGLSGGSPCVGACDAGDAGVLEVGAPDVGAEEDAPALKDAGPDGSCPDGSAFQGGTCVPLPAPVLIAPATAGFVTSRRPTLRWSLPPPLEGAHIDICTDRACGTLFTTFAKGGTSGHPTKDLAPGIYYWRARGQIGFNQGLTTSPTWEFTVGPQASTTLDTTWGIAHDVNRDGYADFVVTGARAQGDMGHAYVFQPGAFGVQATPTTTLAGVDGGRFSWSLAFAGDVNGDGFSDLLFGTYSTSAASLYIGSAAGIVTSPAWDHVGPDGGFFGSAVAAAGDVNGDGFSDIAVGAYAAKTDGRAYVYTGGPTGLPASPTFALVAPDAVSNFGSAIAGADVNADGYSDLVVSADTALSNAGRAYLFLGSATGLSATPTLTLPAPDGNYFGWSVSSIGDVNADGYQDIAIGSFFANRAYIYLGGANGIGAQPTVTLVGPAGSKHFGTLLWGAGDVNADGYADFATSDQDYNNFEGRLYLYYGGPSGLGIAPSATLIGPDGPNAFFGTTSYVGDLNKDGFDDLVVGARCVNASDAGGACGAGVAHVYFGSAAGIAASPAMTLTSPELAEFGGQIALR